MSDNFKWLQFFADGGASGGDGSGSGAGTGVSSADAGQNTGVKADDAGQRLEDLGVPKEKAEKYRRQMAKKKNAGASDPVPVENDGAKSGDAQKAEDAKPAAVMPSWDEYMEVPENKQRLESMMAARGRNATEERSAANEAMAQLAPALELLGVRYGQEPQNGQYDIPKLVEAITGDDLFFEEAALESGDSVDKVKADWKKKHEDAQQQERDREQMLRKRFMEMQQQVPILKQEYPNFSLRREMEDPEFVHLVNSKELGGRGWDIRRAFRAVHQDDIERHQAGAIAEKVKADSARVVQSNQTRPRENGSGGASVPPAHDYTSARAMYRNMTPEERLAYVKNLRPPG